MSRLTRLWTDWRRVRDQRGSTTLEIAVIAPGVLLFIALMVYAGRVELAGQAVQQAAEEAARTASIARGQDIEGARASANQSLANQDVKCVTSSVGIRANVGKAGETGQVVATVVCHVRLGDLALPGVPGTKRISEQATSPLDTYTER